MQFDPGNPVIKLCAEGMNSEARGEIANAKQLFQQAWDISPMILKNSHLLIIWPGIKKYS